MTCGVIATLISGAGILGTDFTLGTDSLDRDNGGSTQLTGIADGKVGSFFTWVKIPTAVTDSVTFVSMDVNKLSIKYSVGSTVLAMTAANSSSTLIMNTTSATSIPLDTWFGLALSWNLNDQGANNTMYTVTTSGTWASVLDANNLTTDDTIDYTGDGGSGQFKALPGGGGTVSVAEYYLNTAEYIDWSSSSNQEKVFKTVPLALGNDASIVTGTAPIVFQRRRGGNAAEFGVNKGTGGGQDIIGTLSNSTTSPSD